MQVVVAEKYDREDDGGGLLRCHGGIDLGLNIGCPRLKAGCERQIAWK